MKKKAAFFLVLLFVFGFTVNVFAADAFADVPSSHWAYQAVKQLSEAGIITGISKDTFAGDKPISRYEMAQMVFNAMERYDKANANQRLLIDALKAEYNDIYQKLLQQDKRIGKLEQQQDKVKISGLFSERYRDVDYARTGVASSVTNQFRLRLDGNINVDQDSYVGFRFVTKAPNKNNLFDDPWTNTGGDNHVTANGTNNTYDNQFDRYYYIAKLGSKATLSLGEQALVIDPEDLIIDSGFYSYGGGKLTYKLDGLGKGAVVTAQYGSFYKGATLTGFTGWGNKNATAFNEADITSVTLNGKVNDVNYLLGHADFRNNTSGINLLDYNFANVGFLVTPKVGLYYEYANNSADTQGRFDVEKIVYGDQELKKKGQWNMSYRYIDAQKNAIFNRYTMFDGAAGTNTNDPEKLTDARINYAFAPTAIFFIQRMTVNDTVAANNANDNVIWKAELDVKF